LCAERLISALGTHGTTLNAEPAGWRMRWDTIRYDGMGWDGMDHAYTGTACGRGKLWNRDATKSNNARPFAHGASYL
jgi:hypothetical protein